MGSFRVVAPVAVLLLGLTAVDAYACSCGELPQDLFSSADLVVKGYMKTITYGIEFPAGSSDERQIRLARGEVEIEKVLKGSYSERILPVYTGSGLGDCGRLGEFINAAVYYRNEKFGEFELGLQKVEYKGQTYYVSTICDYAKGPKFEEEAEPTEPPPPVR
ncbi:hypothetical protein ANOBCDAF_04462 [Pleomorphomonas sp. T1.2MG-36]|uniref:hypothetical protein n=1 Tax=Pleomorphomonas sp. T1.2MG-36 TaxID=3041167 RepID=UPI0024774429|nr:hypothetical protein [Pleomorphomonas sp. T1.2MG-36]CAI9403655.1 hypothetical protein ANOBCDAF_04462 [Pleomorphomonas sp. T1.2MG-36]